MRTACIVQARLGSTRLPAKVLLPLPTGRTVVEEVLRRAKAIPGTNLTVLAVPEGRDEKILHSIVGARSFRNAPLVLVVSGNEHDLIARYHRAATWVNADIIVRITADCPLLDPSVCGEVISLRQRLEADYASNVWPTRSFPRGLDCEVFTFEALNRALNDPDLNEAEREHVGPALQRIVPKDKQAVLKADEDRSHLSWTLDTLEDYERIWNIMAHNEADPDRTAA